MFNFGFSSIGWKGIGCFSAITMRYIRLIQKSNIKVNVSQRKKHINELLLHKRNWHTFHVWFILTRDSFCECLKQNTNNHMNGFALRRNSKNVIYVAIADFEFLFNMFETIKRITFNFLIIQIVKNHLIFISSNNNEVIRMIWKQNLNLALWQSMITNDQ